MYELHSRVVADALGARQGIRCGGRARRLWQILMNVAVESWTGCGSEITRINLIAMHVCDVSNIINLKFVGQTCV